MTGFRHSIFATLFIVTIFPNCFADDAFRAIQPKAVNTSTFKALKDVSPFQRSVKVSDNMILTGIARFENELIATMINTVTAETHIVSSLNKSSGWQLIDVKGDEDDLGSLTAKVQASGGGLISVRHEELPDKLKKMRNKVGSQSKSGSGKSLSSSQLKEAKNAAINFKKGYSADGYANEPPKDMIQKLSKLKVQTRESINREMLQLRNRGLGSEARKKIYVDKVNKALGGKK